MLEKTEAILLIELQCELASARLQMANQFRWLFTALLVVFVNLKGGWLDGVVIGLLTFYLFPLPYRRKLKFANAAYEEATGTSFQSRLPMIEA